MNEKTLDRERNDRFPKMLSIDRTPMEGGQGRRYLVIGEPERDLVRTMGPNRIVFSIRSPSARPSPYPDERPGVVWPFAFFDVEEAHEIGTCGCVSKEQAAVVAALVEVAWNDDDVSDWVFQCEMGMSRSAGMCQAVAEWFGDDEVARECYRRYSPNQTVRRRVFRALSDGRDPMIGTEGTRR